MVMECAKYIFEIKRYLDLGQFIMFFQHVVEIRILKVFYVCFLIIFRFLLIIKKENK